MNENRANAMNADEEAALRILAVRLLGVPQPQLTVGRIPDNLPVEIPVPDGSRVIGSQTRGDHVSIVLDSDLSPEDVTAFYQDRLLASGWQRPEFESPIHPHGGFIQGGTGMRDHRIFCRSSHGPALQISVYGTTPTDVRLQLNMDARNSMWGQRGRMHHDPAIIPELTPPPGAQQVGGQGSFGPSRVTTEAMLDTDQELATTSAHYETQLEVAGWTRINAGQGGPFAWSTWTFRTEEDEAWQALFFVLARPETRHPYSLHLQAEWASGAQGGGSGFWQTPG